MYEVKTMKNIFERIRDSDEVIQISLLSEFFYCKRRCSLRLLENATGNNFYTAEGTIQHSKVHSSKIEKRSGLTKIFNMQVFSLNYRLIGKTDCVECFDNSSGPYIDILGGNFSIIPVEYKHGIVRNELEYEIQLCSQAICLEEMFHTKIERGVLYYIGSNKRIEIDLDDKLRQKVLFGVVEIFKIISEQTMYEPKFKKGCPKCSLYERCNPKHSNIQEYLKNMWRIVE